MKAIVYLSLCLVLVLALAIGAVLKYPSSFINYAVAKLTKGDVHVSKTHITYRDGVITAEFSDIRAKKKGIEGLVKTCRLVIGSDGGLYLKQAVLSDFEASVASDADLSFLNTSAEGGLFSVPREMVELKRGVITYDKQRFAIDRITLHNLKGKAPFSFELEARNDNLFGKLEASGGGGQYKGLETDLKGRLTVTSLNLSKLDRVMQGMVRVEGQFTFEKERLAFEGLFHLLDYTLKDPIFRNPFSVTETKGKFFFLYARDSMDIKIRDASFKYTPLDVDLRFRKNKLAGLEITSGLLDIQEVKDLIALDKIAGTDFKVWDYVREGKVRIRKFIYTARKAPRADLELKKVTMFYDEMEFSDAEGLLSFDDKELRVSGARGSYRTSSFYNVGGTIPFAKGRNISARGNYVFNLSDLPALPELKGLVFNRGKTEGVIQVEGRAGLSWKASGTGTLKDADATWRKQAFSANGSYGFSNDGITFDPLMIRRGLTDMVVKGKWDRETISFHSKGNLDVSHVKPFVRIPFEVNGVAGLDLGVQIKGAVTKVEGDLYMEGISFEIPGIMRKDRGTKSTASLTIVKDSEETRVERFLYNLDVIDVKAKGVLKQDKTINANLAINVPGIEKVAPLFFFDGEVTGGDLEMDLSLQDLRFPLKKLPRIEGYARINNGFLRIPRVVKPLKGINLLSDFKGDRFSIKVTGLKCGTSVMNSGTLQLEGLETPHFSLNIDMEYLDFDDFQNSGSNPLQPIDRSSLMARASGDIHVKAKKLRTGGFDGQYVDIKGLLSGSKLNISEFKMNAFDGNVDLLGSLDLSETVPRIYVNGRLNRMRSNLLMKAFGAKAELADGRTGIYGKVESKGSTLEELAGNVNGNVAMYSRNGSILKWNFLSKVLGFLNLYDSLRGKADLGKEGLPYNRMGATFIAKNGVLSTKDFLIDSPSMVINGDGDVDLRKEQLNGNLNVSPLVALDRTIDKIPILRSILRSKGRGFLSLAYKVKGPIDDPDINVSFVNTIGGGTLDILRNILVLPKELLEGM
jgi:hypothetical protein